MQELHFSNVSHAQMALKAALDGNVKLFNAIVDATGMDPKGVERFGSLEDGCEWTVFFLLFELVKRGRLEMVQELVDRHGFSLRVGEEYEQHASDVMNRTRAQRGLREDLIIDDRAVFLSVDHHEYGKISLIEFAEREHTGVCQRLRAIKDVWLELIASIRACKQKIGERAIDEVAFKAYVDLHKTYTREHLYLVAAPHEERARKKNAPRKNPLFEAERERRSLVERCKNVKGKALTEKAFLKNIRHILAYLKQKIESSPQREVVTV